MDEPKPMNDHEKDIFQFGYEQGEIATEYKLEQRIKMLEEKVAQLEPIG